MRPHPALRWSTPALAILVAASLASVPARADDLAGAKAFVDWIYAHYPKKLGPANSFDPLGSEATRIFHPSLIELIKADQRVGDDQAPDLDGDPLCDCQDNGGMAFTVKSVRTSEFSRATATVLRRDMGDPTDETITLDLARGDAGWRVYDVETKDTPSLRAYLIKAAQEWTAR
jgi:hypothetical protein